MTSLRQSLDVAVRTLRRSPGWSVGVVLTLGLGIGLATAVYTVADTLLLRPLPVRAQDQLVVLWGITRDGKTDHFPLLYADAQNFARGVRSLERVEFFSYGGAQPVDVRLGDAVARMQRSVVSGGYFDLLGTQPLLGRALRPVDDTRGAAPVAVLSYSGWQRFFGGAPNVVGRQIALHGFGVTYTIVGVMPRGLDYPQGTEFWTPVVPNSGPLGDQPIYAELNVIGRLRRGASISDARAELGSFFAHHPTSVWMRQVLGVAKPLADDIVGDVRPAVLAFGAAAGLLLLITCINVANLLLVRGLARARELAVRSALGAGRWRLIGQLLTESALLAVGGGLLGAAFAAGAVRGFVALAPADTPRLDELHVTASIVAVAVAITSLATLLFALAPAFVTSRVELQNTLRAGVRQSGAGRRVRLAGEGLVAGQVALALVVLAAAALVGRSLVALEHVDVAVDPSRLLVAELAHPPGLFADAKKQVAMLDQLLPRIQALPGVRSAAPMLTPPFAPVGGVFGRIGVEGQSANEQARNPTVDYEVVTPSYPSTLGIPLLRGRFITETDREGTPSVVVISESLARHFWPGVDPIGKRLENGLTVVGVVAETRYRNLRSPRPTIYMPLHQSKFPIAPTTLLIATDEHASMLVAAMRRTVEEVAPGVVLVSAVPLTTYLDGPLAQPRLNALLLALFGGAAIALAAVGLFGSIATTVRQRTREIGVRVALGATPRDVRRLVLGRALAIAGIGAGVGLAAALATSRALRSLLFGVSPYDALTLALTALLLLTVAAFASYLPARRAQRIDPMVALRAE